MPGKKNTMHDRRDAMIGTRVRARRLELGMSQSDLARRLGLTFQQIQKYEKGSNRIAASRLMEIAFLLKADVVELIGSNGTSKSLPSRLIEYLATKEGAEMADAMMKIHPPKLRRSVIDLARMLGEGARP